MYAISIAPHVNNVTRIWATETRKPSHPMPMNRIVRITIDRWMRGSRMLGGT